MENDNVHMFWPENTCKMPPHQKTGFKRIVEYSLLNSDQNQSTNIHLNLESHQKLYDVRLIIIIVTHMNIQKCIINTPLHLQAENQQLERKMKRK